MDINKVYLIIYDDKNFKPVKKTGKILSKDGNMFEFHNHVNDKIEFLNTNLIIRAEEVKQ